MKYGVQREWEKVDIRERGLSVARLEAEGWERCEARFQPARWREPLAKAQARARRESRESTIAEARKCLRALDYRADGVVANDDGIITVRHDAGQDPMDALQEILKRDARARTLVDAAIRLRKALTERA